MHINLSVCIEDFDPLGGHEQINLSSGRSLPVGALHGRRGTTSGEVNRRSNRSTNSREEEKSWHHESHEAANLSATKNSNESKALTCHPICM